MRVFDQEACVCAAFPSDLATLLVAAGATVQYIALGAEAEASPTAVSDWLNGQLTDQLTG